MEWMGNAVGRGEASFRKINGPIRWSNVTLVEPLRPELGFMQWRRDRSTSLDVDERLGLISGKLLHLVRQAHVH